MAKTDYKTIDQYHAAFSADLARKMQHIRDIIHEVVPEVEETISYQIPCFKYKGYLLYYSAYTNHISLSNPFSPEFLAHFKAEFAKYKVSKSAIQFSNNQELPLTLIREITEFRKTENEKKEPSIHRLNISKTF